jgi:hypothetical protein
MTPASTDKQAHVPPATPWIEPAGHAIGGQWTVASVSTGGPESVSMSSKTHMHLAWFQTWFEAQWDSAQAPVSPASARKLAD